MLPRNVQWKRVMAGGGGRTAKDSVACPAPLAQTFRSLAVRQDLDRGPRGDKRQPAAVGVGQDGDNEPDAHTGHQYRRFEWLTTL